VTAAVNIDTALHYKWGADCDGWVLGPSPDILVVQERMPPKTSEQRHFHSVARQFFYVLAGELTMEMDTAVVTVRSNSGIEVPPGAMHQARNDTNEDVHFLVISSPTTQGDRTDVV
jgi:mannose-6-phosphate isomerase-like protein (cupin superfamily)